MSLDRLRYFASVVETKNLRKAAELVGISPPSMSKAMAVLEAELGCKLIHPDGRGIGITERGFEVYRMSVPLLDEQHRFMQRIRDGEIKTARLRIATFEVFSTYFISNFLLVEGGSDVLLLEMEPGRIEQAILAGTVEMGITYLPSPDPSLEYREIGALEMGIFGHKTWNKLAFEEWPFAIPTTELRIHSSEFDALDMWPKSAPKRMVKYQFELLETALQCSMQGLSVLYCPKFVVELQNAQVKAAFQLAALSAPAGFRAAKPVKVFLVGRKGNPGLRLEGKLAKFFRSMR